jgi:hypothetical protein
MNGIEQINPSSDWQQLAQENGSLRAIIAELLIKNQTLRWELLSRGPAGTTKVLVNV